MDEEPGGLQNPTRLKAVEVLADALTVCDLPSAGRRRALERAQPVLLWLIDGVP